MNLVRVQDIEFLHVDVRVFCNIMKHCIIKKEMAVEDKERKATLKKVLLSVIESSTPNLIKIHFRQYCDVYIPFPFTLNPFPLSFRLISPASF